jgi:Transcription factor WhiB
LTPTARRTLRITASAQFVKALINAAAAGLRPHCSDPVFGDLWLSDNEADRAEAARLCRGCPVLGPCGHAATANGEKFGTWAGVDRTPRNKPGPRPKDEIGQALTDFKTWDAA